MQVSVTYCLCLIYIEKETLYILLNVEYPTVSPLVDHYNKD